jgi:hypothetical protein
MHLAPAVLLRLQPCHVCWTCAWMLQERLHLSQPCWWRLRCQVPIQKHLSAQQLARQQLLHWLAR